MSLPILAALDDVRAFLAGNPDIAKNVAVTAWPHGAVRVQLLSSSDSDATTRSGILYGLAAIYSGDLRTEGEWVYCDLTWRERRFTLVAPVAAPVVDESRAGALR